MNPRSAIIHILFIEQDRHLCDLFTATLEPLGYKVRTAPNGSDGLNIYAENQFDLVAVDCELSDFDGKEIAKRLISQTPNFPLLLVADYGSVHIAAETLDLGVTSYIIKNDENAFSELLPAIVRDLLNRSAQRHRNTLIENSLKIAKAELEHAVEERSTRLTESEILFHRVVDNMPIGVCLKDIDGKVKMANRQILEWWGLSESEAIGKTTDEIAGDPEEICRIRREQERKVWESGEVQSRHHKDKLRPDGSRRHIIIRKIPIFDEEGNTISLCNTVQDITDIETAETANRAKSEFLAAMSHELRTPLTSSLGSLGLLTSIMSENFSSQEKELLDIAHRNNMTLLRLVDELLDYEKILAGGLEITVQQHDICALTESAIRNGQGYADTHSVNFVFRKNGEPVYAEVQEHRFEQVLNNLLSNAAKFSDPGSDVEVAVEGDNHKVVVRVKDRGPGIPKKFQPKIFEQFTQADASSTRRHRGTGLGLSICKALTEAMGGTLGFDTEVGVGSTFYIEFPISE